MSELESRFVKRGYWVNLAQGPVMGQTITTDARTGAIVVAILAIVTALGMTHLWHLLTFFYHQVRANGRPRDGLFRHQQAVLRTLPSPSSLMADSVKLWYAWRGISDHAFARSLLQLSAALIFALASLAVSIFSSSVVTSTNLEVLVNSPHCGRITYDKSEGSAPWDSYRPTVYAAAESYAPDCYQNGSLPSKCNIFTRPNIAFSTETVPCPFNDSMCASPAIALDSGLIDMNDAFGLNLHEADRMKYRRRSTCTVLPLEGYTRTTNESTATMEDGTPWPGEQRIEYLYGSRPGVDPPLDLAFGQSTLLSNTTSTYEQMGDIAYGSFPDDTFVLRPELQRPDADVALKLVMKNKVMYYKPVDDPLFLAHREKKSLYSQGWQTRYLSDFPGSVVGCALQYQFCVSNTSCTNLTGTLRGEAIDSFPGASITQKTVLSLLQHINVVALLIATKRFEANRLMNSDNEIPALPDDQWIKELQGWEAFVWASHQIIITDYAVGPGVRSPPTHKYVVPPSDDGEVKLCSKQKMRKPGGFVNINFFGLVFTLVVSSVIVLTDVVLLRVLIYLSKFRKSMAPRLDRWIQDGIFQLQRRAHEAQGNGVWKDLADDVPVTVDNTKLPDLLLETLGETEYAMGRRVDSAKTAVDSTGECEMTPDMKKGAWESEYEVKSLGEVRTGSLDIQAVAPLSHDLERTGM
ncbi:uncharacterized protein EI97DRAFT_415680 [Westerdykella ornata]|uniref:Uncharacterized protein n=1 Tax=Westerdykella ornata TaxID=318751 RepID=A0A6A6JPT5_WESOR|nr:uncharacterized protein EI97DRAFT_415680 [Westerdykella ornata]KAF2277918.1 hypothetical protein EI97DRAFT_415680 [Westerdykella ornata]